MSEGHTDTIRRIYAAFGRGDIPGVLEHVADQTRWDFNGGSDLVPWHAPALGKTNLPAFFAAFGGNVDMTSFEPKEFVQAGPHVVVRLRLAYTVKKTGKRVDEEQVQWWTLDDAGKVASLRHFEDTAAVIAANRP